MGSIVRAERNMRVVEALNELAVERMGIKSGSLISQSLGINDALEAVFFFVQINTDDTAVELMFPDPVFAPENTDDDDVVETVCSAFQMDDDTKVRELLEKAEVIDVRQLRSV